VLSRCRVLSLVTTIVTAPATSFFAIISAIAATTAVVTHTEALRSEKRRGRCVDGVGRDIRPGSRMNGMLQRF
jgi:hypothetical protein